MSTHKKKCHGADRAVASDRAPDRRLTKRHAVLRSSQMRALDERAVSEFKIPSLILMENAGRSVAEEILKTRAGKIAVVSGKGNNGGDGLVCARHLHNYGRNPEVFLLARPDELKGDPAVNFEIVKRMGITIRSIDTPAMQDFTAFDLVVDAIFGTGLSKNVEEPYRSAIEAINKFSARGKPVVSVDVPSGLNADTGEIMGAAVKASVTVTLACEKAGLRKAEGPAHCGHIVVGYISMPRELMES